MIQLFDYFDHFEMPSITLCNPNGIEVASLGEIYNRKLSLRFNASSEFSFTAPMSISGSPVAAHLLLDYRRLIKVENAGTFMITGIKRTKNGKEDEKEITAVSLDVELVNKKITMFEGSYEFYDPITPAGTLLGTILEYLPNWSAGTIDSSLWSLYRYFDISDTTIYQFLMSDVEQAYQCVFTFDTDNRTISAAAIPSLTNNTNIFLSFANLVESIDIDQVTDEMVTALAVHGGGDLDIRTVNPLGTDTIYNFSFYETTEWMTQGLIDALDAWEANVLIQQPIYASLLTSLKDENANRLVADSELGDLNAEYAALDGVRSVRISQGLDYSDVLILLQSKQVEINSKNAEIASIDVAIAAIQAQLAAINTALSFDVSFTQAQLLELDSFIVGSTYQNENFIQTDEMTSVEIQDMAQELYDQAQAVLSKVSTTRYEFSIDATNFIFLKDFLAFTNELEMGCSVTLEVDADTYIYPVLLGIDLNYDDPTDFTLTFGNRYRLDDSSFYFSDMFSDSKTAGIKTSFNSQQWGDWENNYKNDVTSFIDGSLNATNNHLINSTNQEFIVDGTGLRGRTLNATTGSYNPQQVWITSGVLAYSNDGFDTAGLALGYIPTPTGGSAMGLVASAIVGNLIAGNELHISNDNNSFVLDGDGATLTNAKFSINATNAKVIIDPTASNCFTIQKNVGGTYTNKFWVNSAGDVNFAGTLAGASGTFSGTVTATAGNIGTWVINSSGMYYDSTHYIYPNDIRLGGLSIVGSTATFNGSITATSFTGQVINTGNIINGAVTDSKVSSLSAGKITAGTMVGDRIYGGTIGFNGGSISLGSGGVLTLSANSSVNITAGGTGQFYAAGSNAQVLGSSISIGTSGNTYMNGAIVINGTLYADGYSGITHYVTVNIPGGTRTLYFQRGILVYAA